MTPIDPATLEALRKLSGMTHAWGSYTPEEWEAKTGINPRTLPRSLIYISPKSQLCVMEEEAIKILDAHHTQVTANWNALGVPNRPA